MQIKQRQTNLPPDEHVPRRAYRMREVAEMFALSLPTVTNLVRRGEIKSTRVGRRHVIMADQVAAFEAQLRSAQA